MKKCRKAIENCRSVFTDFLGKGEKEMYTGKHALNRNAKCPFFRAEYQKTITCTETDFKLLFKNEEEKDAYAGKYCIKEFPYECPVYAGLASKYE